MKKIRSTITDVTAAQQIAQQTNVEIEILVVVEQALRIALEWAKRDPVNCRTIATLRFHTCSFERHVARICVLADHGGYLHLATDANPHLTSDVQFLENERTELHEELAGVIADLDNASPNDASIVEGICVELERVLDCLKTHNQKETELLQRSFTQEEGGSG